MFLENETKTNFNERNIIYLFCLCNISTKITLFQAYCDPMYTSSLWCQFFFFYLTYPQDAVQALCLPPTTLNLLMNAFVHPYLVFYIVFISRIIFFLLITYILIFIIRAVCTHTGGRYYTHDIYIVVLLSNFYYLFLQLI